MPVQRIPRYILLLRDLLKYTPSTHSDYRSIPKALEDIQNTMTNINSSINKADIESSRKLIEIEKTTDGDFEVRLELLICLMCLTFFIFLL